VNGERDSPVAVGLDPTVDRSIHPSLTPRSDPDLVYAAPSAVGHISTGPTRRTCHSDGVTTSWMKINNPAYSHMTDRREVFEARRDRWQGRRARWLRPVLSPEIVGYRAR
jgi:hypothetical protein